LDQAKENNPLPLYLKLCKGAEDWLKSVGYVQEKRSGQMAGVYPDDVVRLHKFFWSAAWMESREEQRRLAAAAAAEAERASRRGGKSDEVLRELVYMLNGHARQVGRGGTFLLLLPVATFDALHRDLTKMGFPIARHGGSEFLIDGMIVRAY